MSLEFLVKTLLPILGGLVAIIGLALAMIRMRHSRQVSRVSNEPELEVFRELDEAGLTEVFVSNEGQGPATIESFTLVVDDNREYPCTQEGYGEVFQEVGLSVRAQIWSTEAGKVLGSGKRISLLKLNAEDIDAESARIALERVKFRFVYRTPYGQVKTKIR